MATIGFIGLGNMGGPMAANLVKAGHDVKVFDLSADAVAKAVDGGAGKAATVAEAASNVEFVVTVLPAGKHVLSVYDGPDGVIANAKAGTVLIDSSTIEVDAARKASELACAAGLGAVDAPISGGTAGAAAGTLTFMVGGSDADFARAVGFGRVFQLFGDVQHVAADDPCHKAQVDGGIDQHQRPDRVEQAEIAEEKEDRHRHNGGSHHAGRQDVKADVVPAAIFKARQ